MIWAFRAAIVGAALMATATAFGLDPAHVAAFYAVIMVVKPQAEVVP